MVTRRSEVERALGGPVLYPRSRVVREDGFSVHFGSSLRVITYGRQDAKPGHAFIVAD